MKKLFAAALFMMATLTGCLLVPFYDGFRQMGVTESDRMRLFEKDAAEYGQALSWGDAQAALAMTKEEIRPQLLKDLRDVGEKRRIVETKLGGIDYRESARVAKVEMLVKYYEIPFYTVKTMHEQQEWVFDMSDGWKLASREVVPEAKS